MRQKVDSPLQPPANLQPRIVLAAIQKNSGSRKQRQATGVDPGQNDVLFRIAPAFPGSF